MRQRLSPVEVEARKEEARRLAAAGVSFAEIARRLGTTRSYARRMVIPEVAERERLRKAGLLPTRQKVESAGRHCRSGERCGQLALKSGLCPQHEEQILKLRAEILEERPWVKRAA